MEDLDHPPPPPAMDHASAFHALPHPQSWDIADRGGHVGYGCKVVWGPETEKLILLASPWDFSLRPKNG